ncbi:MAG: hypothetical protein HUJ30_08675, partial [Gammaproteobacteria bacterium]|nr:hypothetical protein [Gammaproteobacteria bacterium]
MNKYQKLLGFFLFIIIVGQSHAMGIRSFVAMPIDKGGSMLRMQYIDAGNMTTLMTNYAYGLTGTQTLIVGLPYQLSPQVNKGRGDINLLYRYIGWHKSDTEKMVMAALLAVVLISEQSDNSPKFVGAITYSRGLREEDFSAFWRQGTGMMT